MRHHSCHFPAFPAINDGKPSVTQLPGYIQVAGTGPEGNLLFLTEYTGT